MPNRLPSLYTQGGEFVDIQGIEYIGYYHIMEDGTIMSGPEHSETDITLYRISSNRSKQQISLSTQKYNKNSVEKRINLEFNELINIESSNIFNKLSDDTSRDIAKFFTLYNEIFYDIPKEGSTQSHRFLIEQSSEYINFNPNSDLIASLRQEITDLREELLAEQQKTSDLLNSLNN